MKMRREVRQTILVILGLLFLVGFGYGIFVGVRAIVRILASLDSTVAVAIIAAAATILVSVLSIVLGKIYESHSLVQREHREKKIPVYEHLIEFMFRAMMGTKTGDAPSEKEIVEFMSGFTQRVMVWGSDGVLTAWVEWRRASTTEADSEANPMKLLLLYEKLILAIRRDLGHKNKGLNTGDVLALFVNDIDQHLEQAGGSVK